MPATPTRTAVTRAARRRRHRPTGRIRLCRPPRPSPASRLAPTTSPRTQSSRPRLLLGPRAALALGPNARQYRPRKRPRTATCRRTTRASPRRQTMQARLLATRRPPIRQLHLLNLPREPARGQLLRGQAVGKLRLPLQPVVQLPLTRLRQDLASPARSRQVDLGTENRRLISLAAALAVVGLQEVVRQGVVLQGEASRQVAVLADPVGQVDHHLPDLLPPHRTTASTAVPMRRARAFMLLLLLLRRPLGPRPLVLRRAPRRPSLPLLLLSPRLPRTTTRTRLQTSLKIRARAKRMLHLLRLPQPQLQLL